MPITITLDLEDSSGVYSSNGRWVGATERLLAWFGEAGLTATVFAVAEVARAAPSLIARLTEEGHELALHGLRHVPLGEVGRGRLAAELREGAELLEDAGGRPVRGFRAPIFSLTPATAWAVEEIAQAGMIYSSSVLPARNPLHGWPGAPTTPFRWHNGLVELPCPLVGIAGREVPLGGIYLRYLPVNALRRRLESRSAADVLWTYVHPYDVDLGAPLHRFPHANWPTSALLHTRRNATLPRLRRILALGQGAGRPLGDWASELAGDPSLPTVTAGTA